MSRVEAMETADERVVGTLPFPEESANAPQKAKRQRLTDGSMYLRPFASFLSKRYGREIDIKTLRGILTWAKVDCNSRNTSHDWWISATAVKNITELMDIFYGINKR